MSVHVIRKGLNIPLAGEARPTLETLSQPATYALRTADIIGHKFKVMVEEGESVKPGQPLCRLRQFPDIILRAPNSGTIQDIRRGDRRALREIVIEPDTHNQPDDLRISDPVDPETTEPDILRSHLLQSGLWPLIIQRPLAKIAHPETDPVALFINAMATAPLASQPHILLKDREEDLAVGVSALSKLCSGNTYLAVHRDSPSIPGVDTLSNIEIHTFSGPHPAGSPGIQIHRIQPLKQGQTAWCVTAVDAADIGYFLRTGCLPHMRIIALAGPDVSKPAYYQVRSGAAIDTILDTRLSDNKDIRIINGDVLSGSQMNRTDHIAPAQSTLTVVPEGVSRDFMGWGMPGFKRYSALRTFASSLLPRRKHTLDTRLHGGFRPIISIGQWEKVLPMDIHLSYLIRAIQAGDIQEAIELGLLELSEEDVALCAFIDPSKMDVCGIIRNGLDLYETEYL
jgi:Na+-transporting NADH:ubiquinone oxidoreductase subunit A